MWIEEIVLDGFKSYQQRTTVSHLSPQFNAITGLNGSGKSNILDSICFVMGIRSLAQMRVSKMDELVYKQGQAGVAKASVTLVFNNEDKTASPPQYRNKARIAITRQIVIGGRDRYLLNGHNAKPSEILSLFMSVQLNVNNPHFLIMQGRITKVINMKPIEILGLVEEAAGTRMYEAKRNDSAKKIARKETRLAEIQKLLAEEIEPALASLRQERQDYNRWQSVGRQIEELTRLSVAFSYYRDVKALQDSRERVAEEAEKKDALEERCQGLQESIQGIDKRIQEFQEERQNHEGPLKELRNKVKEHEKERMKEKTATQDAVKSLGKLQKAIKTARQTLETAEAEVDKLGSDSNTAGQIEKEKKLSKVAEEKSADLQNCEELLEAFKTGQEGAAEGGAGSLRNRLMETKGQLRAATGEETSLKKSIENWKKELKKMQAKSQGQSQEAVDLENELKAKEATIQKHEAELAQIHFSKEELTKLRLEKDKLERQSAERRSLEQSKFAALTQSLDIHQQYTLDEVKGPAFELFDVIPEFQGYRLALEECGKGKLFHVVVKDDATGQRVLENSQKRMTCIPLNKIRPPDLPTDKVAKARKLMKMSSADKSQICLPLEIIEPRSAETAKALQFVFGTAILCSTADIAKKVSHDPSIRALAITAQGDTYNPRGTVSGGSRVGLNNLLESFAAYAKLRDEAAAAGASLSEAEAAYRSMEAAGARYRELTASIDTAKVVAKGLKERLEQLTAASGQLMMTSLSKQIEEATKRLADLVVEIPELKAKIPQLEADIADFKNNKASKKTDLQKRIELLRKEVKASDKALADHRDSIEGLREKLAVLQQSVVDSKETIALKEEELSAKNAEVEDMQKRLAVKDEEISKIQTEIREKEEELTEKSGEASSLAAERSRIEKAEADIQAQLKKLAHDYKNLKKSAAEREKRKAAAEKNHSWLKEEYPSMNKPGSAYDFQGRSSEEMRNQLDKLETERMGLQRRINKKVLNMLESADAQLQDLKSKQERVSQDKDSIEAFMKDLDDKKNTALEACWKEVNQHFSGIFSSLLPHANARLCEIEGQTFREGLQMKVAFSGVWKSSLSELSGGQRSLLSLSLVLALLKFKPAPLYILDEVDAALDLSHTQNIGQMIRQHFRGSQFIIVSLKENLFSYADVLFRASFVNGNSVVTRTAAKPRQLRKAPLDGEEDEAPPEEGEKENEMEDGRKKRRKVQA